MKENEHKHIEDFILVWKVVHLFLGKTCIYTCKGNGSVSVIVVEEY